MMMQPNQKKKQKMNSFVCRCVFVVYSTFIYSFIHSYRSMVFKQEWRKGTQTCGFCFAANNWQFNANWIYVFYNLLMLYFRKIQLIIIMCALNLYVTNEGLMGELYWRSTWATSTSKKKKISLKISKYKSKWHILCPNIEYSASIIQ